MTQDEIIEMAEKAGIYHAFDSEDHWDGLTNEELIRRYPPSPSTIIYGQKRIVEILEPFAKLVAAKEREACAKVCDELSAKHTWEGCYANECAEAIRARGQA